MADKWALLFGISDMSSESLQFRTQYFIVNKPIDHVDDVFVNEESSDLFDFSPFLGTEIELFPIPFTFLWQFS